MGEGCHADHVDGGLATAGPNHYSVCYSVGLNIKFRICIEDGRISDHG